MNRSSSLQDPRVPILIRGQGSREGRAGRNRKDPVNCAVAYRLEAKSVIAHLLGLGTGLSAWCGRQPETLVLTEVLQRWGPAGLRGPPPCESEGNHPSSLSPLKDALGQSQVAGEGGRRGSAVSGHSPAFTGCLPRSHAGDPRHSGCEGINGPRADR